MAFKPENISLRPGNKTSNFCSRPVVGFCDIRDCSIHEEFILHLPLKGDQRLPSSKSTLKCPYNLNNT